MPLLKQTISQHAPVTVLDSASVYFTLTGQQVTAAVLPAGVDHNSLNNLTTGDPHTQYLKETDFTAGSVLFRGASAITQDNATLFWDNTNKYLALGKTSPISRLDCNGAGFFRGVSTIAGLGIIINSNDTVGTFIAAHTDQNDNATSIYAGARWLVNAWGHLFATAPATTVGAARTWTNRLILQPAGSVALGGAPTGGGVGDSALYGGFLTISSGGLVGIGQTASLGLRRLDILDATNPQLRLTHTAGSVYGEVQATSAGYLEFNATGNRILLGKDDSDKTFWGAGYDFSAYYDGMVAHLKTDEVAASDLQLTTGAAKTLVLNTPVYEDLNFDPTRSGGPAATRPDDVTINNVIHKEFTSANSQLCGAVEELPHQYKLSSTVYPHVHIFLKGGESAGTTGVTFTFYWELRQSTGTTSGSVPLTATSAELGTTAGANKWTINDATGFAGAAELGAQLACTIARTGGDAGDIIVTTYGIHYAIDTIGSRQVTAK